MLAIMRSQGDLDSLGVPDISQPLSKWQYIYLPIGENWNQRNWALDETLAADALMLKYRVINETHSMQDICRINTLQKYSVMQ